MNEKKFQFRVQKWFRQAATRHRNEVLRELGQNIVLEIETVTADIETEKITNNLHFDDTELENEEQLQ